MKLNNKGYLIVEIVLSAVIAFSIMYFLIDLSFNFKSKSDDLYKETIFLADKNIITKTVMDDINSKTVSKLDFACNRGDNYCVDITYKVGDNEVTKRFNINNSTKKIQYGTCHNGVYNKSKYYYEKKLSENLKMTNIAVENNCYGSNVTTHMNSNNILICEKKENGNEDDILKNNGLFTIKFNATSPFLDNDYGINITIPYNNLEIQIGLPPCFAYSNQMPSAPELPSGMIPVYFENGNIYKANINNNSNQWYDYNDKKWANAVMVNEGVRDTLTNASPGYQITPSNITAYYVWIPRYSYELFETSTSMRQVCVNFETTTDTKSTGTKKGELLTHPAFTFGNTEQNGIWVSKFKTTGTSTSTPKAIANAGTNKPGLISIQYQLSQNFSQYLTTAGQNNYDTHLMKNIDWGAVSYLTYSSYGICNNGDGTCNDIAANTTDSTGGGPNWNTTNINQSTTNNVYGIYDMKSRSSEHVMGNFSNIFGINVYQPTATTNNYNHSDFFGYLYNIEDNNYLLPSRRSTASCTADMVGVDTKGDCVYNNKIYGNHTPLNAPDAKYYDLYDLYNSSENFDYSLSYKKGDATYEVKSLPILDGVATSWITKAECQNESTISGCRGFHTWYIRGNSSSILYFSTTYGSNNQITSRSVITKK